MWNRSNDDRKMIMEHQNKNRYDFFNKHHLKNKNLAIIFIVLVSSFVLLTPEPAIAQVVPVVEFNFDNYFFTDGNVFSVDFPLVKVTYAPANLGPAVIDQITITVTTTDLASNIRDSISLVLSEEDALTPGTPDTNSGVFRNTNLIFTDGLKTAPVNSRITITQEDPFSNITPGVPDTVTVSIFSTSDTTGLDPYVLTETGGDSGIFSARINLVGGGSNANSLHVEQNDVISIFYPTTGNATNVLVSPHTDGRIGVLNAQCGDTITASYLGQTDTATMCVGGGPGGGGGGPLIPHPGLVLDILLGGSGGRDTTPPSFTFSRQLLTALSLPDTLMNILLQGDPFAAIAPLKDNTVDFPLLIDGDGFALFSYSNTIETHVVETGKPVDLKLNLRDASGIEHIALYTNLRGLDREVENSDTYLIYNEGKPLEIVDPNGFFSNVNFTKTKENDKYVINFKIVFAKPMETSDVILRTWDEKRNSADTKIFDAIKVIGEPLANNKNQIDISNMIISPTKEPKYIMPLPDLNGNLIYYNSFGDLEQKKVHPYHTPVVYPENVGRDERWMDESRQAMITEDIKAQTIAQSLIGNPFDESIDRTTHDLFYYPSVIGNLNREYPEILNDAIAEEKIKAAEHLKKYRTNHVED